METKELKEKVDKIISYKGDPEMAHSKEDDLHLEIIKEFCPDWVVKEIKRLTNVDFPRWCA